MMKRISYALIFGGVLAIIAGVTLLTVIVPRLAVFPDDVDVVREFDVEYLTLLNPDTLEFIEVGPDEADDILIQRHVVVEEVDGDGTLIFEGQTLLQDGEPLQHVEFRYALDRRQLTPLEDHQWADAEGLWEREGFVIGWEIGVEQHDYIGWNEDTRSAVDLVYEGAEELNGVQTYKFTSSGSPERIDPNQIEVLGLPAELTLDEIGQLATQLEVDDPMLGMLLRTALPGLMETAVRETQNIPDNVDNVTIPVEFYYDYNGQYWVEPTTGTLLNTVKYEHRAATFPPEIIAHLSESVSDLGVDAALITDLLPLTVSEFRYTGTPEAVEGAIADAQDAKSQLDLFGTTIPILLAVFGGSLILAGVLVYLRGAPPMMTRTTKQDMQAES